MNAPSRQSAPLLRRHPANPILSAKDWPYAINSVFNPGATRLQDGSTLLLCRVEDRRGLGPPKTEASQKPIPMDTELANTLWLWKHESVYNRFSDWVYASPAKNGKRP